MEIIKVSYDYALYLELMRVSKIQDDLYIGSVYLENAWVPWSAAMVV